MCISKNETGYSTGHPWYYVLGGKALYPSEIRASVDLSNYSSLMVEDILKAAKMSEPIRSERLRAIRLKIRHSLLDDLNRYLECIRELKALQDDTSPTAEPEFKEIHQSMSLKHNHIYNGYAQLMTCESHLAQQADLFAVL